MRRPKRLAWLTALPLLCSCGSGPSSPSAAQATITIGPSGVSPRDVRIKAWGKEDAAFRGQIVVA